MTRQPDFSSAPRTSRVSLFQSLSFAACALAAIAAAFLAYQARGEAQAATRRLAEVSREVDAARGRVQAFETHARAAWAGMLAPEEAPPSRIVAEVASLLPDDVRLERIAIDYRRGGVLELVVVARDARAWDRLLQQLEAAQRIRELEPGPEARAAEVRSLVRARWAAGP